MSNYSESEDSVAEDFNPRFKAGAYYKQTKSPFKKETVRVVHSKLKEEAEGEEEESEDSEYAEDEDLCDEEEKYMRDRKKMAQKGKNIKEKKQQKKKVEVSEEEEEAEGEGNVDVDAEGEDEDENEGEDDEDEEDNEGEGEEDEDEDEEQSEEIIKKELPQRQTRGKRMNVLVGKALEDDEAFWGADLFKENEEDESFDAASSEDKDSFDSDFDKSEHSNEGEGGDDSELSAEKEVRRKERSEKKKVKFAVPAKKKAEPQPKKKPVKEDKEEDKSSNTSEPLLVGSRRSKRMMERKEEESDEEDSDNDNKNEKKNPNSAQKSAERKREIKEKNKAFLKSHGIEGDMQEKWSELLSKDKLSPLEKIQEAVFTEIINKESLLYLQQMENERVNELCYRDRRPKGPSVKLVQDIKNGHFKSSMIFPTSEFYPKNFNTKKERKKEKYYYQMNTCMITGKKAKYKDPLTLTPYANKDAFKVIRERFFQKEEDKLNMRIHIINELLNQKRDKLKRYQSFDRNLEISQEQREVIMKNAQKMQFGQYR